MSWTRHVPREVFDMTNATSTWVGLIAGVGIGAVITWWIYNRQEKTLEKQETILKSIAKMLEIVEIHQEENQDHQDKVLNEILSLNKKIDSILEKK